MMATLWLCKKYHVIGLGYLSINKLGLSAAPRGWPYPGNLMMWVEERRIYLMIGRWKSANHVKNTLEASIIWKIAPNMVLRGWQNIDKDHRAHSKSYILPHCALEIATISDRAGWIQSGLCLFTRPTFDISRHIKRDEIKTNRIKAPMTSPSFSALDAIRNSGIIIASDGAEYKSEYNSPGWRAEPWMLNFYNII